MKTETSTRDRGVAAIEFVLIAPLLITLLVAVIQVGVLMLARMDLSDEARNGARTLALRGTPSYSAGTTIISQSPPCVSGDLTTVVRVRLERTVPFSIPFLPIGNQPIQAEGSMRCGG